MSWARNSLTARTLAVSGIFAVALVAGIALLVVAIGSLRDASRAALRAQQAVTVGTELERSVVTLESGLRGFVATGREADLAPFTAARSLYPRQVRRLQQLAQNDPQLRADVRRVSEQISDYVGLWALPLLETTRENPRIGRSLLPDTTGKQRVENIRAAFRQMFDRARSAAAVKERRADRRSDLAVTMGMVGIVLTIALSGLLAWLLRRTILRPISCVAEATETIAAGDLTARVPDDRADELGDLARAFNAMAASLEASAAELALRAEDLERSNRELEDYASVTSHDLQGPLVTMGMYAGLLARKLEADDEARTLAENIRKGSEGMRRLVRELLAYARLDRHAGTQEPVDLEVLLRETLEVLAGPLVDAQAEVVAAAELPTVLGDPARLRQVLQNLLANAIKFTDKSFPRVEVSATQERGLARVSVHDHGIGFADGQAELIFRPFQRLHSADRFEGTGIGLAVCQKIVEQHGGRIWAEGRPGEGATFHFTLPLAGVPDAVDGPASGSLVGAGGPPNST